jgi:hypothetical protein
MKKLLLLGIVALVVLVCLPAAVSAGLDDTVVVSGSITGYISVDVTPDAGVSWGAMIPGTKQDLTTADIVVTTTYPTWGVDATDAKATPEKGFMFDTATSFNLTKAFKITSDTVTPGPWVAMDGTFTNFVQKTADGAGTWGNDIGLQQVIEGTDEAATAYSITITFTGHSS